MKAVSIVTIKDGVVFSSDIFVCFDSHITVEMPEIISKGIYAGKDLVDTVEAVFTKLLKEAGVPDEDIAGHIEDGYYEGPIYTYCLTWPMIHGG